MRYKDDELETLIAHCAIGDQKALRILYDKTSPFLNSVAYKIVGTDALSNEVLQESFIQIWQNANQYRSHLSKPLTWMAAIVRYRAIDRAKSESRHANRPLDPEEEEQALESAVGNSDPYSDTERIQNQAAIYSCLIQLNDTVKKCIELAYLYGYSREELAETLGANVNTIKSWLHRGSERLKKCLEAKI